jgi:hypothetical protein
MSFWELSDGDNAAKTATKEFETGGGNLDPIPNNSDVLAIVDQAKWQHNDKDDKSSPAFIELRWSVMAPEAFKNRKVFHKLWVTDFDPNAKDETKAKAKRDKARRMLAAIDANAGGNLTKSGDAPTDDSMTLHLCNKPMIIKCMVWNMVGSDGAKMVGNWVSAVKPSDSPIHISDEPVPKKSPAAGGYGSPNSGVDLDDEIPFAPDFRM